MLFDTELNPNLIDIPRESTRVCRFGFGLRSWVRPMPAHLVCGAHPDAHDDPAHVKHGDIECQALDDGPQAIRRGRTHQSGPPAVGWGEERPRRAPKHAGQEEGDAQPDPYAWPGTGFLADWAHARALVRTWLVW
eukprot:scaffold276940_cov22-Prasinocladus_malaysianus.AAC.1